VKREKLKFKIWWSPGHPSCSLEKCFLHWIHVPSLLEQSVIEGENPVLDMDLSRAI
jgi:hypothetical protein